MKTFQFEAGVLGDEIQYTRLRLWEMDDQDKAEVFEIDEPVQLSRESMLQPQDHIYWIHSFRTHGTVSHVMVTWGPPETRDRSGGLIPIRPTHVVKLPDMLRLAAEASRPTA